MEPMHPELRRLLADEHVEQLRQAMGGRGRVGARLRVARWLVGAGLRLAPELKQRGERGYRTRPVLR